MSESTTATEEQQRTSAAPSVLPAQRLARSRRFSFDARPKPASSTSSPSIPGQNQQVSNPGRGSAIPVARKQATGSSNIPKQNETVNQPKKEEGVFGARRKFSFA